MNWFAFSTAVLYLCSAGYDLMRGKPIVSLVWIGYAIAGFALAYITSK